MGLNITMRFPANATVITAALSGLVEINLALLADPRVQLAPLYSSGIVYRREPPGEDDWLNVIELYRNGFGDCEDLACARASELIRAGVDCRAIAYHTRGRKYHAVVEYADGTIEDPSRIIVTKERRNV